MMFMCISLLNVKSVEKIRRYGRLDKYESISSLKSGICVTTQLHHDVLLLKKKLLEHSEKIIYKALRRTYLFTYLKQMRSNITKKICCSYLIFYISFRSLQFHLFLCILPLHHIFNESVPQYGAFTNIFSIRLF